MGNGPLLVGLERECVVQFIQCCRQLHQGGGRLFPMGHGLAQCRSELGGVVPKLPSLFDTPGVSCDPAQNVECLGYRHVQLSRLAGACDGIQGSGCLVRLQQERGVLDGLQERGHRIQSG